MYLGNILLKTALLSNFFESGFKTESLYTILTIS